ncbi:MAG: peptidoglycan-binding protein [Rhodospirillaceae bacterium]|nr:peptidoglycan-binding protein [Rhodospirillaceae bacterium]
MINLGVATAVVAMAIGITLIIWHDVGVPAATAPASQEPSPAEPVPAEQIPAERAPEVNAQVQEIERLLGILSFGPGPADGVLDSETEAAIRAFQQAAGLPEDGRATPELLDELKAVAGE